MHVRELGLTFADVPYFEGSPLFILGDVTENLDRYLDRGLTLTQVTIAYVWMLPLYVQWSFPVAALIAAREFDQQYEWSAHEPAAVRAGVEQSVIDAIKFNRPLTGVPEKDATLIRLGRAVFRDHTVSSELWAQMEKLFGRQGAIEVTMVMADYAMVGFILTAVDQQLPADRKPLLPPR